MYLRGAAACSIIRAAGFTESGPLFSSGRRPALMGFLLLPCIMESLLKVQSKCSQGLFSVVEEKTNSAQALAAILKQDYSYHT